MMTGYNLFFIERDVDQTGEMTEADPFFLHLAYGTMKEAETAKSILEQVYGAGSIEISEKSVGSTFCPGEGA